MATRPPNRPELPARTASRKPAWKVKRRWWWPRWARAALLLVGVTAIVCLGAGWYFWVQYAHEIDKKLAGEQRAVPRIFGRAFDLRPGLALTPVQLAQRLNDVAYADRPKPEQPGEFNVTGNTV